MLETVNLDGGLTNAGQSLAPFGSLFTQSGILRPGSFTVSALDSPGMFVEVSGSDDDDLAIIKTADGATYFIRNTLPLPIPILANSSGVTKTDAIVLFVDLAGGDDENAGSPGAAEIIAVRRDGISTGLPNDGEIDAATSNNPWIFLKEVEVTHNTGEIEADDVTGSPDRAYLEASLVGPASVDNLALADEAVANANLKTGAGEPGGAWQTYAMAWTANSSNPAIGNGTITAKYKKVGRKVTVLFHIQMGSTTTYGSGYWMLSLPVPAAAAGRGNGFATAGVNDAVGSGFGAATGYPITATAVVFDSTVSKNNIAAAIPFTWASGDSFYGEINYEAAN